MVWKTRLIGTAYCMASTLTKTMEPINFYKSLAVVDFLCFISAFRAIIPCLAPDPTEASGKLAAYYDACMALARRRPR